MAQTSKNQKKTKKTTQVISYPTSSTHYTIKMTPHGKPKTNLYKQ